MEERSERAVRERLTAYILPNVPETQAQLAAFADAVAAQMAFEAGADAAEIPPGVTGVRLGDYALTLDGRGQGGAPGAGSLSPTAWSILKNAGLLARTWPTARRY